MLEIPEARTIARQMDAALAKKRVQSAVANASPHSFAWYCGDPAEYSALLEGLRVDGAAAWGGQVEMRLESARLVLNDGANPRLLAEGQKRPPKHQLLMEFTDGTALCCTVAMYGGIMAYRAGTFDNGYFQVAREKPSPLGEAFDAQYFADLRARADGKLSLKAFLATEQRIPGLGNGVLQDILFAARLHPRRKLATLADADYERLYRALRETLYEMTEKGGRDVERDLFGDKGGYQTKCSKNTVGQPCPVCGAPIRKEPYLGGAIYYCPQCQTIE